MSALVSLWAGACTQEPFPSISRENLFTLEIGLMEDQIALYNLEGDQGIRRTELAMREGLFYISDGKGAKIARYNSYGDLLFMIYNDQTNPLPLTLLPLKEGEIVTRWALTYPLLAPGKITVDSRKHLYVEDQLPDEGHRFDPASKAIFDKVILHFDEYGRFVQYLGQEGIGGSPFPKIEGLYTSLKDELAVVCRLPAGWHIYWFDAEGTSLYVVKLQNTALPIPPDRDMVFASLDAIGVAPDERKLYLKVDYYRDTYDESTNTRSGSEPDSSVIWVMAVEDGSYERTVEVPFFETILTESGRKTPIKLFYSLLGAIRKEQVFLYVPVEAGYALLILDAGSAANGKQHRGFIQVDPDELQFNAFALAEDGILSGILVDNWDIKLVWWRTDKLIGDTPL
ncbi:MAG: hypothetical protein LBD74_01630 [Spirochaetaceae bacterium]|jgi:hypothetical protein|nr:hypothetical protein [Spirochaetaceae bacterium]